MTRLRRPNFEPKIFIGEPIMNNQILAKTLKILGWILLGEKSKEWKMVKREKSNVNKTNLK